MAMEGSVRPEIYRAEQSKMNRAIPGQSLTNDPANPAPYEQAPKFTNVHEANEYFWNYMTDEEIYPKLMTALSNGVPVMKIVQVVLFNEFQKGLVNPDLMLMLFEPTAYMIMALAEREGIEMTIYEGDLEDDDDEEQILGTTVEENRIQKLIKDGTSGRIPEGILTAEMQQSLETLPEINLETETPAQPSLMAAPASAEEEEEEQSDSLMAKPAGV